MKYKNGAIDLTDLALGIVVLGIVVSISAVILHNIRIHLKKLYLLWILS